MNTITNLTGLVLKKTDYKASSRLVTLFTKEEGVLLFGIRGISRKNMKLLALSSPLTIGHFQIRSIKGTFSFADGTPTHHFDGIRNNLRALQLSCEVLRAILTSQPPHSSAPLIFDLALFCLTRIDRGEDPDKLLALFLIKLLKHEGLIAPSSFRLEHSLFDFSTSEQSLILAIMQAKEITAIAWNSFSSSFLDKLRALFKAVHS